MKHKGIICGILAAVCYGTNPFGALPLYEEGVNTSSVLFYRFSMAVLMLAVMLLIERKSFRVNGSDLKTLGSLGLLFAASSITYYQSFRFMDAGIASTILFVYPVMVAVIMATFFREKVTVSTVTAIILALMGIGLLYRGDAGASLSTTGVFLVMVSSLTYVLCVAGLHVVFVGLFVHLARPASDVAAIATSMVLCLLAGAGAYGSFAGADGYCSS